MPDRDRFLELSESELISLLDQKNSDNTTKATKVALNVLRDYLKERKIAEDSLVASKDKLATGWYISLTPSPWTTPYGLSNGLL